MKKIAIVLGVIVALVGVCQLPLIKGVEARTIKAIPDAFTNPSGYSGGVVVPKNQTKKDFYILIPPTNIPNNVKPGIIPMTIDIDDKDLPFYGQDSLIANVTTMLRPQYSESIVAEIISQDTWTGVRPGSEGVPGIKQIPIEWYRLKVEFPDNLKPDIWAAIQEGVFSVTKTSGKINLIIPEKYVVTKGNQQYVCKVTHKRESIIYWDAPRSFIKGRLQKVSISGTKEYFSYADNSNILYSIVQSGIDAKQEIVDPTKISNCR